MRPKALTEEKTLAKIHVDSRTDRYLSHILASLFKTSLCSCSELGLVLSH